jgi:hypothetical protein
MRNQVIALVTALVLAPLGARAADLVVWWSEGYYAEEDEAVREIVAAFEGRSSSFSVLRRSFQTWSRRR